MRCECKVLELLRAVSLKPVRHIFPQLVFHYPRVGTVI